MTWSVSHVQYVTFSIIGCPILELFQSWEKLSFQAGWECKNWLLLSSCARIWIIYLSIYLIYLSGSRGLMDSESDLWPEGCGFESQVRQGLLVGGVSTFNTTTEVSLSKAPNPQLLRVCVHLGWVKCREYISLLVIYSLYNRVCDK